MKTRVTLKPELVVAGPGAGKTYGMVQHIISELPNLPPSRFLAVITYTNAAVESIQQQLDKLIASPSNLFVGTNHSFLIRFVLKPYGKLLGLSSSDLRFIELAIDELVVNGVTNAKPLTPAELGKRRAALYGNLAQKGIVPFTYVSQLANKIIENKRVLELVSRRLHALFIDELQDIDNSQYNVIEAICIAGRTKVFAVGDPQQYITTYLYKERHSQSPNYQNIPFFKLQKRATVLHDSTNRRASPAIVQFTNQFQPDAQHQIASRPMPTHSGIYYLDFPTFDEVITEYRSMVAMLAPQCQNGYPTTLYLARSKQAVLELSSKYGLPMVSGKKSTICNTLSEIARALTLACGLSEKEWRGQKGASKLDQRVAAMKVAKLIRDGHIVSGSDLLRATQEVFEVERWTYFSEEEHEAQFRVVRNLLCGQSLRTETERCSTIHKAKGLEADAVLVIPESQKQLQKWLVTDQSKRQALKDDDYRIGFVAFTRARDLLCISCLKPLNAMDRSLLVDRRIEIVSSRLSSSPTGIDRTMTGVTLDILLQ